MATKKDKFFSKQPPLSTSRSKDDDEKFSNFNLNQNHKCSILPSPVHSFSKSNYNKNFDKTISNKSEEKNKSWNTRSPKSPKFVKLFDESEEEKELLPRWKKKTSNAKNSTLSLHISAYENSIDSSSSDANESFSKKFVKEKFIDSSSNFQQNSFEFPRQMNSNEPNSPEIMQFTASQKLLSLNENSMLPPPPSKKIAMDIAIGTMSYNLVFIEVLRFQHRFFVSAYSDYTIQDMKVMLKDIVRVHGVSGQRMELYAFYPQANNFTVLKDDSTLAECGFRPDRSTYHQPGIVYLTFGKENPAYVADSRNHPVSPPS